MKNRISLKNRILKYARRQYQDAGRWINGGTFERLALENGYKASNASRRCRELQNEGSLIRKDEKGSVWYQATPPKQILKYFDPTTHELLTQKLIYE